MSGDAATGSPDEPLAVDAAERKDGIRILRARPEHAEALERLQRACFPNLGEQELMRAEHFRHHQRLFPEGEFVALAWTDPAGAPLSRGRVVGLGSGFLVDFDFDSPSHTFQEIIGAGWYSDHDPDGAWYYGADISVHPDYRGRGIGSMLYRARQDLVRRLGRRGIVAGGALPGFREHRGEMGVPAYVDRVVAGELFDPTLSFQLRNGFAVRGLLQGYIEDAYTDDWATLLVWENPDLA
jgi:GNAT superfamily N-acetyltransferase